MEEGRRMRAAVGMGRCEGDQRMRVDWEGAVGGRGRLRCCAAGWRGCGDQVLRVQRAGLGGCEAIKYAAGPGRPLYVPRLLSLTSHSPRAGVTDGRRDGPAMGAVMATGAAAA